MNPGTIRWIDINLGQPICWCLTMLRGVGQLFGKRKPSPPKRILFIKFIEQGATVLAYSAIKKAVDTVGRENVFFVVFQPNRPILDLIGIIPEENVLVIRDNSMFTFLGDTLKTMLRARKLKLDSTVDMEFFSRASAIFAYMTGARNRVGLHRFTSEYPYRGNLMTHKVAHNAYVHTSVAYLLLVNALVEPLGEVPHLKTEVGALKTENPRFKFDQQELADFKQKLATEYGAALPSKIVLLNPNASDMLPLRKWETNRFVQLGKQLLAAHDDLLIVITGAPAEAGPAAKVCLELESTRAVSMAGKTSLRELFLLYQTADLLVTNDSGPAHFASMTDTVIVVLFGPETPQLFGPMGNNVEVIWKGLACSPCVNAFNHRFSPCNNNLCMQQITVQEVYERVSKRLRSRAEA